MEGQWNVPVVEQQSRKQDRKKQSRYSTEKFESVLKIIIDVTTQLQIDSAIIHPNFLYPFLKRNTVL